MTAPTLAAATLAALAGDEPARRRSLAAHWRAAPERAAAVACAAGAHRPGTATDREEATRSALGGVAPAVVLALVTAAHDRRQRRQAARETIDELAARATGQAPREAIERELARLYHLARFRAASHCHDVELTAGPPTASSDSGSVPSVLVGMPSAYCKKAYKVATSVHRIQSDAMLFAVPRADRVGHGWLRLTPEILIRQGRGTSLVVERRPLRRQGRAA